jgi:hypothetical protein
MNDPTGIGTAILGAMRFTYWGLALACLGLALWLPKPGRVKVVMSLLVIGAFVGVPTVFVAKQRTDLSDRRSAIQAACSTSNLVVRHMSSAPGFYVGPDALVLVSESGSRAQLIGDPGLGDVVNYLVDRKMSFFELATPSNATRLRRELGWGNVPHVEHPYLRISVAEAGTATCAATTKWLSEYPAQKLPELRRRGLMSDHCIAVEGVPELRSRYRVSAKVAPAVVDQETRHGLWEYALDVQDIDASSSVAAFRLFVGRDMYSNRWIGCNKEEEARRFERIVPIAPDPRLVLLREVKDEEPADFPVSTNATSSDIEKVGKLRGLDKINSTNIISDDGMIWFENNYKATDSSGSFSHRGYFLAVIAGGELRKTLVRINGKSMNWITGLQVTDSLVRLVARPDANGPSWLVEYSRKGEPVRALALSHEQVEALKAN